MKRNDNSQKSAHEKKQRIPVWLYPNTLRVIDNAMEQANCKSRSEFLENAARMYAGYISANNALTYLPPVLMSAVRGAVQDSENRIARLLFKQAVELDMVMNVVAGAMRVDEDTVKQLRATCIENVKKTGGTVTFDAAVKYQRGDCAAKFSSNNVVEMELLLW